MEKQLNMHSEKGWPREQIPKEFIDKPALELCWRGLIISISEGCMSRKQAYEMLKRLDEEDNVIQLDDYRKEQPPDLVA